MWTAVHTLYCPNSAQVHSWLRSPVHNEEHTTSRHGEAEHAGEESYVNHRLRRVTIWASPTMRFREFDTDTMTKTYTQAKAANCNRQATGGSPTRCNTPHPPSFNPLFSAHVPRHPPLPSTNTQPMENDTNHATDSSYTQRKRGSTRPFRSYLSLTCLFLVTPGPC